MKTKEILSLFMAGTDFQCYLDSWEQIMKIVWQIEIILKVEPEVASEGYFDKTSYVIYHFGDLYVMNCKKGVVDELAGFAEHYLLTKGNLNVTYRSAE